MEVASDTGAFLFEGLLLAQRCELSLKLLGGDVMHGTDVHAEQAQAGASEEPPRLIESAKDGDGQRRAGFVPDTIFVAGLDVEAIVPIGQLGVPRGADGARTLR